MPYLWTPRCVLGTVWPLEDKEARGYGGGRRVSAQSPVAPPPANKDEILESLLRGSSRVNHACAGGRAEPCTWGPLPGLEGSVQEAVGFLSVSSHMTIYVPGPGGWCCRRGRGLGLAQAQQLFLFLGTLAFSLRKACGCQALPVGGCWPQSQVVPLVLVTAVAPRPCQAAGTAPSGSRPSGRFEVSMPSPGSL